MTGTRKFKAWLITLIINGLIYGLGIFFAVQYSSDSITTIILINSTLTGAFFGANFGEHWTQTKVAKDG